MPKKEKDEFDKVMMMSGNGKNGNTEGGILSVLLASIGITMIMKLLGSGLHNTSTGGYKTHIVKNTNTRKSTSCQSTRRHCFELAALQSTTIL